jgi:hypothetical protein
MSLVRLPLRGIGFLRNARVGSLLACFRASQLRARVAPGRFYAGTCAKTLCAIDCQLNLVRRQRENTVPKFIKLTDKDWGEVTVNADRIILYRRSKESYSVVELDGRLTLTVEQEPNQIGDQIATAIRH